MTTVTLADMDSCKLCRKGTRSWFTRHGLSWSEFVKNGLPAEAFLATGDGLARQVVEAAMAREGS